MNTITTESIRELFPFTHKYLTLKSGQQIAYVDEGSGPILLCLHGNPTWAFFYRNIISHFSKNYRVISIDNIGCGLSDKPQDYNYTLSTHIKNAQEVIETLKLQDINIMVHDWGGAIGMGVATQNPELFKKFIVMNTAAFNSKHIPKRIAFVKTPVIGEWMIRTFNLFAGPATTMSTTKKLDPKIKKAFLLPYHDYKSRIATSRFVQDIPLHSFHPTYKTLDEIEKKLHNIKSPVLLLWGKKDFCFDMHFFKRWTDFFPKAKTCVLENAGHYLLEDETEKCIYEIEQFLK